MMDIVYNWTISGVDGTPLDVEGRVNTVRVIHWRCAGHATEYPSAIASRNGFVILDEPGENYSFIDYNDITEEMIMNWLFQSLDKKRVESEIAEQLRLVPRLAEIKNKSPLWMHWIYGEEPTVQPPIIVNDDAEIVMTPSPEAPSTPV